MAYLNTTTANFETFGARMTRLTAPMITRYKQHRLYRETFNGLSALTDRDLADLGLHRSQLQSVARDSAKNAVM